MRTPVPKDQTRSARQHGLWWPRVLLALLALLIIGGTLGFLPYALPDHSAVLPRPFGDPWYLFEKPRHGASLLWRATVKEQIQLVKETRPRILFIGDSLTERWRFEGEDIWNRHYAPRDAMNLGIGGDRTENVLWRLRRMSLNLLSPEVTVILIGVNNLNGDSPEETARGVLAIVDLVQTQLPETQVVLLSIFPASYRPDVLRRQIQETNAEIEANLDGLDLIYLDFSDSFLDAERYIPASLMGDGLHLTEEGYRVWAEAMEPTLSELLGPVPPASPGLRNSDD
jgi:beta-glucosidase